MDIQEKTQLLKSFALFKGLSKKELNSITKYFEYKSLSKNTHLIKEGSIENEMYFIISGLVRIYHLHENGKEMTIAMRMPGEVIGEMSVIEGLPRSASAQTLQETTVLTLTKKNFLKLFQSYPSISLNFLEMLSHRLRDELHLKKIISFQTLEDRAYHILKTLSTHFPKTGIPLSHEQLSILINATQPRVTEALHTLEKSKKISIARKKIQVH